MKILNRLIVTLLGIMFITVGAKENFALINANWGLTNAPVVYYRVLRPDRLVPQTGAMIKELRGQFDLKAEIQPNETLVLELSANNAMSNPKRFNFSPDALQKAIKTLNERQSALKAKPGKTPAELAQLKQMQQDTVKATTCYIAAQPKLPSNEITLSPQNPTSQYSKQTAQGLSLQANVTPSLVAILEEQSQQWMHQKVYSIEPVKPDIWRNKVATTDIPTNTLLQFSIPEYVFKDAAFFGEEILRCTFKASKNLPPTQDAYLIYTEKIINIFKSKTAQEIKSNMEKLVPGFFVGQAELDPLLELVAREFFSTIKLSDSDKDEFENQLKLTAPIMMTATNSTTLGQALDNFLMRTQKFDKAIPAWKRMGYALIFTVGLRGTLTPVVHDILVPTKYKFMFRN